ncbi:DUF3375 domain-containing protein [Glutamicibacter sp. MNS18]|uniref:DUF3375 domain-containing protein n=1 Tax=Glutamicibacter sp. MNS18 TaxID=2989817 RepID=UPI002235F6F7|nr:DUF3375 domain-containing protein [Glutamicibacter sp. MNS18]MCW4466330.1 DUF3375 domain-containing protein [Glutamicibacter sp. MNS18]
MSAVHAALTARRLLAESPAWSLLRTDNAPVAFAVLGARFSRQRRQVPAAELIEAVEADLDELRDRGFELPQTATLYVRSWLADGFLVRRPGVAREEIYELSDGALTALRFIEDLATPRTSVTESRLATIVDRVRTLNVETDPDISRRVAALQAERDRIDARIAALSRGEVTEVDEQRAVDSATDILSLASQLPEDFARVRAELEKINRGLRAKLVEDPASRGSVLDDIFRGVDLLAESDAGRSFSAFHSLLLDPEQTLAVDEDIDQMLGRSFARRLTDAQRLALRDLLPGMQDSSAEVSTVMTALGRSLRRFVQSEELAEDRAVHRQLRSTMSKALSAATVLKPYTKLELSLPLTGVQVSSPSAMSLHNPTDSQTATPLQVHESSFADLAALREAVRASEIDFTEITENVNQVLDEHGSATIAEVLDRFPATQGIASVVGLLVLAESLAHPAGDTPEPVSWASGDTTRHATVPRFLFQERIQ